MRTKNSLLLALGLFGLTASSLTAQVAINNSATNPDASAILDLKSGNAGVNKGFLPQSVALTNVNTAAPVVAPAKGLIVYSSAAPTGGNGKGYYFWNGTAWASMNSTLNGSGTATQVAFWNSSNALSSSSNLYWDNTNSWLGIQTSTPAFVLDVNGSNFASTAKLGSYAPVCFVADNPMVGFNAYWSSLGQETYYSSDYAGMIEFNQNVVGGFQFLTAPSGTALSGATMSPAMTIANNGYVGIGTTIPAYELHVSSVADAVTAQFDNAASSGEGLYANSTGSFGYGLVSTGDYEGVLATTTNSSYYGLAGGNNAADVGGAGVGVYGGTNQDYGYGVEGFNFGVSAIGVGILGEGAGANGSVGYIGEGVYGEGVNYGVYGHSDNGTSGTSAGGYFDNGYGQYDYVGANYGSTAYKIIGIGTVSTIVKDQNNTPRVMACPEAPEILFEDYGTATLSNGKVHVDLDPTYANNVTINSKHELRVLITLEGDCNGVYVTNKTATGFDVVELKGGTSNIKFTYEVIANRADEFNANGKLVSKNADNRFVEGPGPLATQANVKNISVKPVTAVPVHKSAYVAPVRKNTKGSTVVNSNLGSK